VLGEVYLGDACEGNPVFPEDVHYLLKRRWTTRHLCGKGVERKAQVSMVVGHACVGGMFISHETQYFHSCAAALS